MDLLSAEERLAFLEQVLATSVAGIVVLDARGRFHYANRRAEEILGRSLAVLQRDGYDRTEWHTTDAGGEPVPASASVISGVLRDGQPVQGVRRTIALPDGSQRHLLINAAPLVRAEGSGGRLVLAISDITEQVEHERELRWTRDALKASETRFRQMAENIGEIFWVIEGSRFVYVNRAYERLSGRSLQVLYREPLDFLEGIHPDDRAEVMAAMDADTAGQQFLDVTYRVCRADGQLVWLHTRSFPVEGAPHMRVGLSADVTAARVAEQRLERLASVDPLTGAWNRLRGEMVLEELFDLASRHGRSFALALFDLDLFKHVNDRFGHQVGDQVLVDLCRRVQSGLRRSDTLIRWGGEEFLLCLPETELAGARELVERLRELIAAEPFAEAGSVTASFGLGVYREGDDAKTLLKRVDNCLYRAKERGRNRTEHC